MACFVTHVNHSIWDREDGRVERLKELFKEESVIVPNVLNVQKSGEILPTDLSEIKMKRLYKGRVVLLGDAAHGFEPFAGIGSSMALEDSYVLAGELIKNKEVYGVYLAGGGALIRGLPEFLTTALGVPVVVAPDPLTAVVRGTAMVLDDIDLYHEALLRSDDELVPTE